MSESGGGDAKAARNLSLIQRIDKKVTQVVGYASHVVIYAFNEDPEGKEQGSWERENVEGALFIVFRKEAPFYRMLVINRVSPTNMIQPIGETFEHQILKPYLIFKNESGIKGVWFSQEDDREKIGKVLDGLEEKIADGNYELEAEETATETQPQSQFNSGGNEQQIQRGAMPPPNYPHPDTAGGYGYYGGQMPPRGWGRGYPPHQNHPNHQNLGYGHPPVQQQNYQSQGDPFLLSKEQMQETLLKLIKNDRFVDLLHKEYVTTQRKKHAAQGSQNM